jgi:hypothetical protein
MGAPRYASQYGETIPTVSRVAHCLGSNERLWVFCRGIAQAISVPPQKLDQIARYNNMLHTDRAKS